MNTHSERNPRPSRAGLASESKLKGFSLFGSKNPCRSAAGFFKSSRYFSQQIQRYTVPVCFLALLVSCSSFPGRGASVHPETALVERPVRISNTVIGSSIMLSPPLLHIAPGESVVWINQTTYDVRINFDADSVVALRPSVIPRHSTVRGRFNEVGTYPYTLLFSSSKTFGKVRGEIVVGDPEPRHQPPLNVPDKERSPEGPPVGMPEII